MKLGFAVLALLVALPDSYAFADTVQCTKWGGQVTCRSVKERFEYMFSHHRDGEWCLALPMGTMPDRIICRYESKAACADDNPGRNYANQRCVKNPKFDDESE